MTKIFVDAFFSALLKTVSLNFVVNSVLIQYFVYSTKFNGTDVMNFSNFRTTTITKNIFVNLFLVFGHPTDVMKRVRMQEIEIFNHGENSSCSK